MDLARIAANQQRTFHHLWTAIQPHVVTDSALPRRIKELLSGNRSFGSRDRRLYRELIYTAIRFQPWVGPLLASDPPKGAALVAWLAPTLRETKVFRDVLAEAWPELPDTLEKKAAILDERLGGNFSPDALLPAWFREECPEAFSTIQLNALNERARLWIRLQCRETAIVFDEFRGRGWTVGFDPDVPAAASLPPNAEVAATDAYRRGFVEIQDLGSQLVLAHAATAEGQIWLDACAGAGGKTLQLAALVGDRGRVDALDIRSGVLDELRERAQRAKLTNIRVVPGPTQSYDGVLVDAPCSGSGTWRRLPHMKWHLQPEMLPEFSAIQLALLSENARRVRAGGLLVYATCSLSHRENRDVVARFTEANPDFSPEASPRDWGAVADGLGQTLFPATRDSDGFYVAVLRRKN